MKEREWTQREKRDRETEEMFKYEREKQIGLFSMFVFYSCIFCMYPLVDPTSIAIFSPITDYAESPSPI